ncbi:unnamed protein product [Heterobilharzia americana]|nr:unnamed protein product [Heterobilharzia americana]CAH8525943.1 unnamed protein product [Heterobilharzia americana]
MAELIGTWKYVESFKMDELYSELSVPKDVFNATNEFQHTLSISLDDNELHLKKILYDREIDQSFELGQEVQELTLDGRIVLAFVTVESDKKMVHIQRHGFTEIVITREVDGDILMTVIQF